MDQVVIDYLNPDIPAGLRILDVPLVRATPESLKGFGEIVRDPEDAQVEIVPWPVKGRRKLDPGTGDEGGTTEGIFACEWQGNELARRQRGGRRRLRDGLSRMPEVARPAPPGTSMALAYATTIPTAASSSGRSTASRSSCRLAPPGEDPAPEKFVAFWSDGSFGIYLHPDVWHEGPFPTAPSGRYFDKQGKVHGRVSCDLRTRARPDAGRAAADRRS